MKLTASVATSHHERTIGWLATETGTVMETSQPDCCEWVEARSTAAPSTSVVRQRPECCLEPSHRSLRRACPTRVREILRARNHDAGAVGHRRNPAVIQVLVLEDLENAIGRDGGAQNIDRSRPSLDGDADAEGGPSRHDALVEVGHLRLAGGHDLLPVVGRDLRQRRSPRHTRIDELLAARARQEEVVPADLLSGHRLPVECLQVAFGQRRRGGERLERGRSGRQLPIDGDGRRPRDVRYLTLHALALEGRGPHEHQGAENQRRQQKRQAVEQELSLNRPIVPAYPLEHQQRLFSFRWKGRSACAIPAQAGFQSVGQTPW